MPTPRLTLSVFRDSSPLRLLESRNARRSTGAHLPNSRRSTPLLPLPRPTPRVLCRTLTLIRQRLRGTLLGLARTLRLATTPLCRITPTSAAATSTTLRLIAPAPTQELTLTSTLISSYLQFLPFPVLIVYGQLRHYLPLRCFLGRSSDWHRLQGASHQTE
jgi:hypothetical protein